MNLTIFLSVFAVIVVAGEDYSKYPDGEGLSPDDLKLIKYQFKRLAKKGNVVPEVHKVLKAMIMTKHLENQDVHNYQVAYVSKNGILCSGFLSHAVSTAGCNAWKRKANCYRE
ncbi:hypothetical protein GE061_007152 [Apolygus lucorum]|uniref:Cystatin domain-containing protein n=1 Tax=Apolygus lucorum TaxID=248454 RepID=A0A6A4IR02_APOLU|nr:hypothetical protein GE061_007152 [Apolygus lucorum]